MKTLHYIITIFLLTMIFFPSDVALAQNEIQHTIEFDEASYSTKNMHCDFYNTEKTSMSNQAHDNVIITVTDSNANKFSTSIDRVVVFVWSDSDRKGIEITAYETEVNSGIFKGKVTISEGQSTQDIIHVSDGDTLSARYAGTTPESFDTTSNDVTTTSFIGLSCPPLERVPASSLRILDTKGNEPSVTTVGKQVQIVSDISNPTPVNQNFTYVVQIQDKNGSTVSLAWLSGTMLPKQTSSPSVSWTPDRVGNYVVTIFVWQSLTNPNALSPPLFTDLTVLQDFTNSKSSIRDVKNLHCQLGFELIAKPTDGSTVCVTPDTAKKLAQRGWGTSLDMIKVENANDSIAYHIDNGRILSVAAFGLSSTNSMSGGIGGSSILIISLDTTSDGTLTITMPRILIDAKIDHDHDDNFSILADGQEISYNETSKTVTSRTLSISYHWGVKHLEIIGYGYYNKQPPPTE